MAKRRANGEGSITRRPDGRWEARLSYVDPATGQRKRASFYADTSTAATAAPAAAGARVDADAPVRDASRPVGDWVATWRDSTLAAASIKESTRENYGNLARRHLEAGTFSKAPLDRLRATDIEKLILDLRKKGLSDSTVRSVYGVLRQALDGAVRDSLLARNPAHAVQRPGVERVEARSLTADERRAVLAACEGTPHYLPILLAARTGLRKGEVLALKWTHVDWAAKTVRVVGTLNRVGGQLTVTPPNTQRSRRVIPLSAETIADLKRWRTEQKQDRLRAGSQWTEHGLVFTNALGGPVDPRNVLRTIQTAARHAGVEGVTMHTLRHTAATTMLEGGVPIKAVSDLIGHSSVAITGDIYGHTSDSVARAAMELLSGNG